MWSRLIVLLGLMAMYAAASAASEGLSPAADIATQLNPFPVSLTDFTPQSDPEQLLGLPGQYIAKAQFIDANDMTAIVEVFAGSDDLISRLSTLQFAATPGEVDLPAANSKVLLRLFSSDPDVRARAVTFYSNAMANIGLS